MPKKKKNILFLISLLKSGGAERDVSRMTIDLSEHYNIYIFLFESEIIDYEYKGELFAFDKEYGLSGGGIKNSLKKIQAIRKYKKEKKIDVCISLLEGPNILNVITSHGEKTVLRVLSYKSEVHRQAPKKWRKEALAMKVLYRFADLVVGNSRAIREDLVKNFQVPEKIAVNIPNYYDIPYIEGQANQEIDDKYAFLNDAEFLVTSGRLSRPKGHFHLLNIFEEVKKSRPTLKLVMLGRGEDHDDLIAHSDKKGLRSWSSITDESGRPDMGADIYYLGFQNNPFSIISKSSLFVFTSLYEGFPNALAEAMICGCPVISTDCLSGPREMLAPEQPEAAVLNYPYRTDIGTLMPAFQSIDAEEAYVRWDKEINFLLEDAAMRMSMGEKAKVHMRKYSKENIFSAWENVIDN